MSADRGYDLVIIGAGSGNMLPNADLADWNIAIVEVDRFGGTCLNRGCIPSKMLVHTADVAQSVRSAERFGIEATWSGVDWPAVRNRIFGRIDPLHEAAVTFRRENGIDVYLHDAYFIRPKTLQVGDQQISADRIVLASGSRPVLPKIDGLDEVPFLTSDSIMRLATLPASLIVVGGGYISAEMSHVFGSFGVDVTIIERGDQLLAQHDLDVRTRFTRQYQSRFDVRLGAEVTRVTNTAAGIRADFTARDGEYSAEAEAILIATGRTSNSDRLNVVAAGIELDPHGHVLIDQTYRTTAPGIWAFGDLANHFALKHMANAEGRVIRHNLLHPEAPRTLAFSLVPSAVFADPQVASVGKTEQQLQEEQRPYVSALTPFSDAAYGWALEDTTSFVKLLADPESRLLVGAHIMGPQAATLIQPLLQAMCLGNTVEELAQGVLYIHPALTEVVEQCLLSL